MFGKYLLFGFLRAAESLSWPGAGQGRGRGQAREAGSCSPCPSSNEDKYCLVMIEWLDRSGHHDLDTGQPTKLEPLLSSSADQDAMVPQTCWAQTIRGISMKLNVFLFSSTWSRNIWDCGTISLLWTESANFSNIKQWYLLSWLELSSVITICPVSYGRIWSVGEGR